MAGNIGGNQPPPPPRWRSKHIIVVPIQLHDLPRHHENIITKFDPNKKESIEEHLLKYTSALEALHVENEDVACILFSYSL